MFFLAAMDRQLETIRQYGHDRLVDADEAEVTRDKHRDWFLALAERAWEVLGRFGLTDIANSYAAALSGGQRRLVELMRALMARPKLLLLDEPMAGVSPPLAVTIAQRLEELRDTGMTMLMVEHELRLVERLCDPVVVMAQGTVLAEGSMAALRSNPEVIDAYLGGGGG